jgi:hypothetical protein
MSPSRSSNASVRPFAPSPRDRRDQALLLPGAILPPGAAAIHCRGSAPRCRRTSKPLPYVGNQPIVRVDPFGLWAIAVGFGGEGGWGKGGSVVCYAIFGSGGYVPGCSFGFGGYTPGLFGGLYFAWFPKVPNTRALCGWGASTSFGYGPIQGGIGATKGHLGVGGAIGTPRGPLPYGYSGQVTYTGCGRKEFSEPPDFSAMP